MANSIYKPGNTTWVYRSLKNNNDINTDFNDLEFGRAIINLKISDNNAISGTIGQSGQADPGDNWSLDLTGSIQYGAPATLWFQGAGFVNGSKWVYEYLGYLSPLVPNGFQQVLAFSGSVIRVIDHPNGNGGTSPAGVVCSFYAVQIA